jgi:hypothetical protein
VTHARTRRAIAGARDPGAVLTVPILRNTRRRQERRLQSAERVVNEMRRGQALHCRFDTHEGEGAVWKLSGGYRVGNQAAETAISNPHVVAVDIPLFPGFFSQVYRYVSK